MSRSPKDPQRAEFSAPTTDSVSAVNGSGIDHDLNKNHLQRENPVMAALAGTLDRGRRLFGRPNAADTPTSAFDNTPSDSASSPPIPTAPKMHFTYASGSSPLPRYTIRRGVGIGGFGEVYFAVSEAGKEVAIKRIQRNLDVELRGVSHCLNLKHPNLVSLFDVCRDDQDQAWVIMEYIAGPNLREVLDQHPQGLPEEEVRRCLVGLASGIAYLHDSGLVHRDLKPGNVFDDAGIIKIGDYGLSKFISASRRGGHTESVGTFHYMAPEVGRGEYGREIDIYALGVILCELLTGRVPFDGESSHEIVMKHLTAQPDLEGIASPYREVIKSALEKDPRNRPQSIAQMLKPLGLQIDTFGSGTPATMPSSLGSTSSPAESKQDPILARLASPPAAPGASAEKPIREEPLARAIRGSLTDLARWWESLESYPGTRIAMMFMIVALVVINTGWLVPLLTFVAIFYVPYYIIRHLVLGIRQQPSYAEAHQLAVARAQIPRPLSAGQWRQQKRIELASKRSLTRMTELSGSWTKAIFWTAILGVVGTMIGLRDADLSAENIAPYALTAVTIGFAALALLGMGKLWERGEGEPLSRRLVLAGVGIIVGSFAYVASEYLLLPIGGTALSADVADNLPQNLYTNEGVPRLAAMMAHFALLMGAVGWWKNTDPLRKRRLSVWTVAVAVVFEWAISLALPIPQPWGILVAGGIAIVLQLASPWENRHQEMQVS
ncbi:Serine/threonine-protein kinase PrkC [Roseimaritima multifibrata]|uniref:Serine/threonine-protein kinase PrkC n=1 Tax=Roseimaritima multifibrata TaxID=1930274 RepID=A0A517M9B1_9BACT|nr:serine/threonine-protein kinase [Roseimaritima multifibrata]QDS91377.1 Serine/threonine-protein kinase PrkC [Roseimaritima multifibrata]